MSMPTSKVSSTPSFRRVNHRPNWVSQVLFGSLGVFLPYWAGAQVQAPTAKSTSAPVVVAQSDSKSTNEANVKPLKHVAALNLDALGQSGTKGYSTAFLQGMGSSVDVKTLLSSGDIIPGSYRVDLYVNTVQAGRFDVTFSMNARTGEVEPCFTKDLLKTVGVNIGKIEWDKATSQDASCLRLPELIPQASAQYDTARLRLSLGVPQAYMSEARRGYVEPSLWSDGVPVAFANYNFNTRQMDGSGSAGSQRTTTLGLNAGVNLGPWHFRNNSYLSSGSRQSTEFRSQNSYVQRDLTALRSQLWLGDTYTTSQLFDGVRFRGVQMASDDAMLPDSQQGYAPVIRGTADSNATIEVRQNGFLIYTTSVAPGPFEISDLSPSGSNGNLEITVIEADGRRRVSLQAFSSPPLMVREGRFKYDATIGQFRNNYSGGDTPTFGSTSFLYGLNSNVTLAGGAQASSGYQIYSAGVGLNTSGGAFSVDAAHSRSNVSQESDSGSRVRFIYGKYFENTATNVSFTAQQSLNEGFRTLADHVQGRSLANGSNGAGWNLGSSTPRTQLNLYLNQNLGVGSRYGSLYVSAGQSRNWDSSSSSSISAGYSNTLGPASYNLGYTHSRNVFGSQYASGRQSDNVVSLTVTFPLGQAGKNTPNMYTTVNRQNAGTSVQTGVSGRLPTDHDINYSVTAGRDAQGDGSASAFLGTATSMALLNAGYAYGNRTSTGSFQANGSIVAHQGGVNFGQPVGETFALAQIDPPVPNVRVSSYSGVETGRNGYAIVPNAVPYRANWVAIDAKGLSADVEVGNGMEQVIPRRGAAVVATFKSDQGRRVQFVLTQPDGSPMPFGAVLEDGDGARLGIADPRGRVLVMLPADRPEGELRVIWDGQECQIAYHLPAKVEGENYQRIALACTVAKPAPPALKKTGSGIAQAADPHSAPKQGS
ncbi:fimbria/pilus outer membrane usher protein [Achromobacter aegrifaciens]|uniref:fimbria/pilus outer membrane usher protein n=1 Tax=Achromobacter aegrifaciens TaxID=1287736 RepID=UPI0027B92502|nr:fimbria/pilus outer membrane usher protein [Achromobacter aegrifaciens]WLW63588.1 fimbria/pilus outer membrane usher protein [Achromobacter aegrifaciens]